MSIGESVKKENCVGCMGCEYVCPVDSISSIEIEGFIYPRVDNITCIECGKCVTICPAVKVGNVNNVGKSYVYKNNDNNVLAKSTSGGFLPAIAEEFINQGGLVCGARFDCKGNVVHCIIDNAQDIEYIQGSKYVQSSMEEVYSCLEENFRAGKKIMFIGTPCQCSIINNIFHKYRENLVLVDFVCYGVPSPSVYKKWRKFLEKKWNSEIKTINFRDKSYGFYLPNVKVIFKNGKGIEQNYYVKSYLSTFFNNINVRPSCANCDYKCTDRLTDITMGDCWSSKQLTSKLDGDYGASLVYIHSLEGEKLFQSVSKYGISYEVNKDKAIQLDGKKMVNKVILSKQAESFWNDYYKMEYLDLVKKYCPESFKQKMINIIKPMAKKNHLIRNILIKFR